MKSFGGKIRSRGRPFVITPSQRIAHRVANVALPARSYGMFRRLREMEFARWGDYGLANDPRKVAMPRDQYLATNLPPLPSTEENYAAQSRSLFETRDNMIRQGVGAPALSVQAQPARAGIASAPAMAGALSREMVDDSSLPITLAQTLGSGMLSQAQLEAASFNNVHSLINMSVGTAEDKREAAYFLQRLILEGFVRGVDVARQIKNAGGLHFNIKYGSCGPSCAGFDGNRIFVDFNPSLWRSGDDISKLNIFYQEVGHALGTMPHTRGLMAGTYQYSDLAGQTRANYKTWVDWYFQDVGKIRFTPQRGNVDVNQVLAQHPDWFPAVSGGVPNTGGPPPPGGGTPPGGGPPVVVPPNVNVGFQEFSIAAPQVTPWSGAGSMLGGGGGPSPGGGGTDARTPVAGTLPDLDATKSFAMGLADTVSRSSGLLGGMAAALAKFKSG